MSTNNSARQTHVSPGIYTKETDLTYAVKSLGITTLGLVGETVKGPAFQPLLIEDWNEYKDYFGGTNPSKFKGSGYLKYEAPYIAKSYLKQSKQLYMTRVLGLSGSNMGPAWAITAHGKDGQEGNNMLIAILRSRGEYKKTAFVEYGDGETVCEDVYEYDKLSYYAKSIKLTPTKSFTLGDGCDKVFSVTTDAEGDGYFPANQINFGKFTIEVTKTDDTTEKYNVSLNPGDKNYILNVLGSKQDEGNALVYVEELYDVALQQLIEKGYIDGINKELVYFPIVKIIPNYNECNDLLSFDEKLLTKKDVGKRYLATQNSINPETGKLWNVHKSEDNGSTYVATGATIGNIYQVVSFIESDGTRAYYYYETGEKLGEQKVENEVLSEAVYVLSDNMFYVKEQTGSTDISPVTCDLNNYKEQYRFASTPWIVSELKGDAQNVEMVKLFRFHTISDGNAANIQIKISIENIKPDDGLFDVVIRSFYDTDASQIVLERYGKCSLVSGTSNYIGLKIGTSDGAYVTKSKYVTVEINDDDKVRTSVPCGFLGYPVRNFKGVIPGNSSDVKVSQPILSYNTMVDEDIKARKQYFGLSDLTGIDEDILAYKGVEAYNGMPEGLTPSFHLDSRLVTKNDVSTGDTDFSQTVTVDGETGYTWTTVSRNNVTSEGIEPRIGTEALMEGTIYENVQYRKFTVVPYGGWDGWDVYRSSRTTSDDFKYSKYKGTINYTSGIGTSFDVIRDPLEYNLDAGEKAITSDWYAFLSAIRTFANPKTIDINVLATPGIDYVNDTLLVQEVIEMVEEERADSVYVVTTPDKPFGASDSVSDMYTPEEAVYNLEDTEIDSNYTCSYYPNIQYYDEDNNVYVYLPPTKDVVRNFAQTDNVSYPWFAPAGWERGSVDAEKPKKYLKLSEQDTLYQGRLNFINSFAQDGFKIWGQKNFQLADTQMNRISTRRLLLRLRKLISIACIKLIFDPNDSTTKDTFKSLVNPILQDAFNNRGISDFRIDVDDSVEARERHELPAKIWIKPIGALEYIDINFMITPEGANFDDY